RASGAGGLGRHAPGPWRRAAGGSTSFATAPPAAPPAPPPPPPPPQPATTIAASTATAADDSRRASATRVRKVGEQAVVMSAVGHGLVNDRLHVARVLEQVLVVGQHVVRDPAPAVVEVGDVARRILH